MIAALAGTGVGGPPINYYWDFGGTGSMNVAYSVAQSVAGATDGGNNTTTAPPFVASYNNGDRKQTITAPDIATAIPVPATFDEGGNFIRPMFGPLTLTRLDAGHVGEPYGDYHVSSNFLGGQTLMGAGNVFPGISSAADLPPGVRATPMPMRGPTWGRRAAQTSSRPARQRSCRRSRSRTRRLPKAMPASARWRSP